MTLVQQPGVMRLGAAIGQTVAEIQISAGAAAAAMRVEGGDRGVADVFGNRNDPDLSLAQQAGDQPVGGGRREA